MTKQQSKSSKHDAIEMLAADHKEVQKLFKKFEKAKDDGEKKELVTAACTELTVHSQIEEEIFYPAAREAIEAENIMDEAEVEHTVAKQLVEELKGMEPGDPLYDAKFTVLGEYIKHHIEEEEKQMFPKAKKAKLDLESLGNEMATRKQALLGRPKPSKQSRIN
jgi:hemerythrin superfamily protein